MSEIDCRRGPIISRVYAAAFFFSIFARLRANPLGMVLPFKVVLTVPSSATRYLAQSNLPIPRAGLSDRRIASSTTAFIASSSWVGAMIDSYCLVAGFFVILKILLVTHSGLISSMTVSSSPRLNRASAALVPATGKIPSRLKTSSAIFKIGSMISLYACPRA